MRRETGTVKFYSPERGFGFIEPEVGGADLFFHNKEVEEEAIIPGSGATVEYEACVGDNGKPFAKGVKLVPIEPGAPGRHRGEVKWYSEDKGYGFIARDDGQQDLFMHKTSLTFPGPEEGQRVEFGIYTKPDGRVQASQVAAIGSSP